MDVQQDQEVAVAVLLRKYFFRDNLISYKEGSARLTLPVKWLTAFTDELFYYLE